MVWCGVALLQTQQAARPPPLDNNRQLLEPMPWLTMHTRARARTYTRTHARTMAPPLLTAAISLSPCRGSPFLGHSTVRPNDFSSVWRRFSVMMS